MWTKRFLFVAGAGLCLAAAFAIFVWPTAYTVGRLSAAGSESHSVRVNRFTGALQVFDGSGWFAGRPSGRWLRDDELRGITGDAGFAERKLNAREAADLILAGMTEGVNEDSLARRMRRRSFDMEGPFSGRIYNGTTMAIERLNIRVSCKRHDGSVAREAVYSFTGRIEPLTASEFALTALRCDNVATVAWTVDAAYGHEFRNVANAIRRQPEGP